MNRACSACIVNYGATPTQCRLDRSIHAKLLGNFGNDDTVIKPEAVG
jgi:hypothetical protein